MRASSGLLARRQAQTRQPKLAMLGVPNEADVRYHDRGDGPQPPDNLSCVVEPTHMREQAARH